jgi:ribosomal protein S18 acetylase RimI-like enzyme
MVIQKRLVCQSDYDWLYRLHREAYLDLITRQFGNWNEEEQLGFFLNTWKSQAIKILTVDEEPVGMLLLNENVDHLWLAELQIAAKYQNNGIGSEVIQVLLIKACELGLPLRLRVLHENQRAQQLYQRLGFRRISGTEDHYVMEHA